MVEEGLLGCNCWTRDKKVYSWITPASLGRAIIEQRLKLKF